MIKQEEIQYYKFHPQVLQAYKDADFFDQYVPNAGEENVKEFWSIVDQVKQPVKREITKVVRLKKGGKEYFYYQEELTTKDHVKNEHHCFHTVGKYKIPVFNSAYDPNTRKIKAKEIVREEEVYELEWPKDWNQELEDLIKEDVDLVAITTGRKYGGYSFDDFKEHDFNDLVFFGRHGTFDKQQVERFKKNAKSTT